MKKATVGLMAVVVLSVLGWSFHQGAWADDKDLSVKELQGVPEQLELGDRKLKIETYLWRDFMPISPPGGKPLIGAIKLMSIDKKPLPKGVRIETVWVINGDEVWKSAVTEVREGKEGAPMLEVVVRDGPKWKPGTAVDVVVLVKDGKGETHMLRAADQGIHATH